MGETTHDPSAGGVCTSGLEAGGGQVRELPATVSVLI